MALKSVWFKNPDDREAIENAINHSPAFKRLREIVENKLQEVLVKEFNIETYKQLDWAYVQAHINGQVQELNFILNLLDQGDK